MSALPSSSRYPSDMGYAGLRMSADEYLALGETFERYELIDGVVVESPGRQTPHSEMAAEICYQLKAFARQTRPLRVFPETDLRLDGGRVYRPDLCVFLTPRLPPHVRRLDTAPALVIEILSPGSKPFDYITKRGDYESFGVGEYWVVDPTSGSIRSWRRVDSQLVEAKVEGDTLPCVSIPGFVLDLPPIRELASPE